MTSSYIRLGSLRSTLGAFFLMVGVSSLGAGIVYAAEAEKLKVHRSPITGMATFVTAADGGAIPVAVQGGVAATLPGDFLEQYGHLFGISDPATELAVASAKADALGMITTTYQQQHHGIPVFAGVVKVHQRAGGAVSAANGDFFPVPEKLTVVPTVSADEAESIAADVIAEEEPQAQLQVEQNELTIVDPGWYGDRPIGARLAYHVVMNDPMFPLRESFFIDAHSGDILDRWSMIHTAKNRAIYDGQQLSGLPGVLARSEGQGPVASPTDVNRAYDYYGDTYDFYFRAFGRDSIDGAGMTMIATVNSQFINPPCPNAFWNGQQMAFCLNTVTDDVVGHELTHGVTEHTANLVYQNQPGQLNEAYSDIFGELIDLYNGNAAFAGTPGGTPWPTHPTGPGLDTPNNLRTTSCSTSPSYSDGMRWLMGEDATAFGGAIRDMWNPPCMGDPDRNNSPLQTCPANDSGGVHSGSGIANHAFAMMVDGQTFNGFTVTGIGPIKAGAVWYRALTTYLTVASDYADAYVALNAAAADLIGTTPNDPRTGLPSASAFTAADAIEVDEAMQATEMNTDGACGATVPVLDSTPPTQCPGRVSVFFDDFEGGVNGWTVTNSNPPTPYNWVQTGGLPWGRAGTAWFADDPSIGDCQFNDESGTHTLFSPTIVLPATLSQPTLAFAHYLATEGGYDGGNVSIRVNGGAWQLLQPSDYTYNDYNTTLVTSGGGNTNPMAGQVAWSGAGGTWGTSLISLTSMVNGGDSVQFRFDFGKDGCTGIDGWYLDDFDLYNCPCTLASECDDGLYCNGEELCVSGACQSPGNPCGADYCDESTDSCIAGVVFREDFENGNTQGWDLNPAANTATAGDWEFGNPTGTLSGSDQAQPEDPFEGSGCAFTAQNSNPGQDDVDNGAVYMVSPVINLSNAASAQLKVRRWFFNRDLGEDSGDWFRIEVSNNNGSSWTQMENLGTNVNANSWTLVTFDLQNFVTLTSTVRLRFGASDGVATGNLLEGAVDDLVVLAVLGCSTSAQCNDSNPCTNDVCSAGVCSNPPNTNSCNDGNACTTIDTCSGGVCVGGTPLTCNDSNPCTNDSCNPASGCVFSNNTNPCSDGNACTTGEACSGGSCVGGSALVCNDNNECTDDSCNPATGCVFTSNSNPCDDGQFCTDGDVCTNGTCAGAPGGVCAYPVLCDEVGDSCGCAAPSANGAGSRYVAVTPATSAGAVALWIEGDPGDTDVSCVGAYVQADGTLGANPVYLTSAQWGTVMVRGAEVIPQSNYRARTECGTLATPNRSSEASASTGRYGDLNGNSIVNLDDILLVLNAFQGLFAPGTSLGHYDLAPCAPNGVVNLDDILAELAAFAGGQLSCPAVCP